MRRSYATKDGTHAIIHFGRTLPIREFSKGISAVVEPLTIIIQRYHGSPAIDQRKVFPNLLPLPHLVPWPPSIGLSESLRRDLYHLPTSTRRRLSTRREPTFTTCHLRQRTVLLSQESPLPSLPHKFPPIIQTLLKPRRGNAPSRSLFKNPNMSHRHTLLRTIRDPHLTSP